MNISITLLIRIWEAAATAAAAEPPIKKTTQHPEKKVNRVVESANTHNIIVLQCA